MTVEQIRDSIKLLHQEELRLLLAEIQECLRRQQRMEEALQVFVGSGKGCWTEDAQQYVTELRSGERSVRG